MKPKLIHQRSQCVTIYVTNTNNLWCSFVFKSVAVILLCLPFAQRINSENEILEDNCFCQLKGQIDDCTCTIDTLDYFNNKKIYPKLQSILVKDYFRYFKVNLERQCPYWADDSTCSMKDCTVQLCPDDKVPIGLKGSSNSQITLNKYSEEAQGKSDCDENHDGLGAVNLTISDETFNDFKRWRYHDDSQDNFCEMDDVCEKLGLTSGVQPSVECINEYSSDSHYVDLLLNPERFTGYQGKSAHRIWKSIYRENCFPPGKGLGPYSTSKNLNAMCLEKRVFYRAISGMHSSINIHLCADYFIPSKNTFQPGKWGPNLKEFRRRFDPKLTNGEGPQRLKNLYFLYLLELRALAKAGPYLENELYYTGNNKEDSEVKKNIVELLDIVKSFPEHFNESVMFSDLEGKKLKEEFKSHFMNISKIMDCVGCSKCKLWGKLQVQGLGTALKILFSGDGKYNYDIVNMRKSKFQLTRAEIVTLLNAFGRLSNSVYHLDMFRHMIKS